MKKQKATALTPDFDPSVFEKPAAQLPPRDAVQKTIAEISQPKPTATPARMGRVKLTTAIYPDLLEWLKIHAVKSNVSPADILDIALREYRKSKEY